MIDKIKINKRAAFINPDQVVLPRKLTAENGAKYLLSGEFFEEFNSQCPDCCGENGGKVDINCKTCEGSGEVVSKFYISWTTIKALYKKIVANMEIKQ